MTLYSLVVIGLFVGMYVLFSIEMKVKDSLIVKQDKEIQETVDSFNELVDQYNELIDFLEEKYNPEELEDVLLDHKVENYLTGEEMENMNPEVKKTIREHIRSSFKRNNS